MGKYVNRVLLVGRLGRDVEIKYTAKGVAYARLSVATSDVWKDKASGDKKEKTIWHTVIAWGDVAEGCVTFGKGNEVCVEGSIDMNEWTDKNSVTHKDFQIKAYSVREPTEEDRAKPPRQEQSPAVRPVSPSNPRLEPWSGGPIDSDDIPF